MLAFGDRIDGLEDLDVARAAAQVRAEMAGHVAGLQVGALLVDLRFGAHHDPRDAEPALQAAARGERVGERGTLFGGHTLERHHGLAGGLRQRLLAADDRLAIDVHGAATALPRGRAAVLRRRHIQLLAQRGKQVRMIVADGHRLAVELEVDAHVYILSKSGGFESKQS